MDIEVKFSEARRLYYAKISDGSRYGRKIYGATQKKVKEKLQGFWSMPTKQNRDSTSIGEVLSGFILHMEKRTLGKVDGQKRIRLQSYENYKSYHKALVALSVLSKPLGDYKIQQIDKSFLNEILNGLEQKYNRHSAKHKHELFSYFKSAMLWLHKQDRELYPLVDLREIVVKLDKKEAFVPKRLDAQLVLRTIDQVCMEKYAIFAHLCANGLRASEANGLKPSDFDWTNNTVHVQRIVDRSRNVIAIETGYEMPTKTKSSNRKVPLGSELANRIRKFIMSNPNLEWLFQSDQRYDGRPIKQQNLTKSGLHKALKHLESKGQRVEWKGAMHGLRHYYGSLLLAEAAKLGRNPTWVQKRLGHSNLQTTLGIYSHDIDEDNQELNNEVERRLNG